MLTPGDLYFDHNSTSPLLPEVRAALAEALEAGLVNPQSAHQAGTRSRGRLDRARAQVAALLGADPQEIVFTSGATEANHLALFGLLAPPFQDRQLILSAIEHSSTIEAGQLLGELGATVTPIPPRAMHEPHESLEPHENGEVRVDDLLAAVTPRTACVALMAANNETGVLQPVEELAAALAPRAIPLHVDAVQIAGRRPLDLRRLAATTLSLSAHKLGGPTGTGALFVRHGTLLRPFLRGGRQERGRRGGTHNLLGIIGFGVACEVALQRLAHGPRLEVLRDSFEVRLRQAIPDLKVVGAAARRLPNTSSLLFPGLDGRELLDALSQRRLFASAGSACQSGAPAPSHVLRAMGFAAADARAMLRFSLGPETGAAEVDRAASIVIETTAALRSRAGIRS